MALFKISKGLKANLPSTKTAGYCWYTTDDSLFYIDYEDENGVIQRKALNAKDAETLAGASLATILNSSNVEIPTSQAVFDAIKAANIIHVGPTEPTDPNIKVWINTAEEGTGVTPILPIITSVNLPASGWTGSNPYSQTVDVPSASSMSMITLQPSAQQIVALQDEEISMTVENDGNGVITFYAINGIPTFDMTMQILISAVAYA